MTPRMAERKRQQRAAMIVGGAAAGGLAIIGLAIALSSGGDGDDTNAIDTRRTTTTSSSTTSSSTTSTSTTTLLTLPPPPPPSTISLPTLPPPTLPPPTNPPPTNPPPTNPPPTSPPSTAPTTTTTLSPTKQLSNEIATALNGGVAPGPGQSRVTSLHIADPADPDDQVRFRWKLIDTLTPAEQEVQARIDAFNVLRTIQNANLAGDNEIIIRATIPNPSPPPATDVVVMLRLNRDSLDAIDFTSTPPSAIFDFPMCNSDPPPDPPCFNDIEIDTDVVPPSTTTTTTDPVGTTTTSTTDPDA